MLAWPRPVTMKPAYRVRRQSRPPPVQREEMAAAETVAEVAEAAVESEVAEAGAAVVEVFVTALEPRAQFR